MGCARRERDLGELQEDVPTAVELRVQLARKTFACAQSLAEVLIAIAHRHFQACNGTLGDFGRGDQLRDGALERLLIGFELLQPPVEHDAERDGQQQQHRDQAFDHQSRAVAHWASIGFEDWSAISNMANVVFGLRSGFMTRTATLSPTRPMRPSVSATSPQRTVTSASGLSSSVSVSPTSSDISCFNGISDS